MIEIKKVEYEQLNLLREISIKTFYDTFLSDNKIENLEKYILENLNLYNLKKELENKNSIFYFAYFKNQISAYLKVNFLKAQTEDCYENSLEIQRIYVLEQFQNCNIGKKLLQTAIDIAKSKKLKYIWLGVWEKNTKAINFYLKNNFTKIDQHVFQFGDEEQIDLIFKLDI